MAKYTYDESYTLKPFEQVLREDDGWRRHNNGWRNEWTECIINREMLPKFGNEVAYKYCECTHPKYTHRGEEGFYYHSSWFEEFDKILKFDDKEFFI